MINFIRCAAMALILIPVASGAQDYSAGVDAYNAGDYASALRVRIPAHPASGSGASGHPVM